jgi:hydroxypyruvate reductase
MLPQLLILAPLPEFLRVPLSENFICHDYVSSADPEGLIQEVGPRVQAIIQNGGTQAPVSLLEKLPSLEIITVNGVGYDGVPVDYCKGRCIRITNTPDVLTDDVADIATALVLMTSRALSAAQRFLLDGRWESAASPLTSALNHKTAGIVGLGRIGKAIAQRLEACGMRIAYTGRKQQEGVAYRFHPTLETLAAASDFLIIACPGGPETHHLIDSEILTQLGPKGTLINISRGSVVDEAALIRALEKGQIKGVGLDVFENEPRVPRELRDLPNAILLPHVGSATIETRQAMADLCLRNLDAHFSGQNLITPVY